MVRKESQFRSPSTINCCHYCVPPKRHTACWGHCPEYLKEKAEYEAIKAARRKKENIEVGLDAQQIRVCQTIKKGRYKKC